MIFNGKKPTARRNYTIIELLVVLVIAGMLTGLTIAGIKGVIARQSTAGAVRTLSTKLSLAQSFAVSRNRYVALLLPDDSDFNNDLDGCTESSSTSDIPIPSSNTDNFDNDYPFTRNRMCYVTRNSSTGEYEFDRWIEGYEWQRLPSKTIAFIVSESSGCETSNSAQVVDVDGTSNSSAVIFKPSGALVDAGNVVIRVYRAAYVPAALANNFFWQGKEDPTRGWKIVINGFTGRPQFCLGGESVD